MKLSKFLRILMMIPILSSISLINNSHVHASSFYHQSEKSLTKEVNQFGKNRRKYHHPTINWNARDLGGYKTYHGNYVKTGRIYRGGKLDTISNTGIRNMNRYHIYKIIDLRSLNWHSGMRKMPDPGEYYNKKRGLKAIYYVYPTNTDKEKLAENRYKRQGEYYCYGNPFVTYKSARRSYYDVFQVLLHNPKNAVYFHCLEGHDRTGTTAAIILAALDVPKRTIYNDFYDTEYYQHKYPYTGQQSELNHFYYTINKHYGSMWKYLHKGIGLKNWQINKLRRMYLVK